MFFKYGSYQHEQNEVELVHFNINPVRNSNDIRIATRFTMQISGELYVDPGIVGKEDAQANLTNKINLLINAYKDDFKDAGFYQDNGLPTPHVLPSNHPDNLTGNIVINRNWPMGDGNEYATKRTFSVGISALFKNAYSNIVEYTDSIAQQGDGGPVIKWYMRRFGPPGYQILFDQSLVVYEHQGMMTALNAYPVPPLPLFSRPYLLGDQTKITRFAPKRYAQGYAEYRIAWSYTYVLPAPTLVLPTTR
jgi:hypothetical protein